MAGELIIADGQVEWAGLLLGDDDVTLMDQLTGWEDLPNITAGNVGRPTAHGSWPGAALAGERVVTFEGWLAPVADFAIALRRLRQATTVDTGPERPLVVRLLGETLMAYGRVTARALPADRRYATGAARLAVQWTCSDPRRYTLTENTATAALAVDTGAGLDYPLTYPLDYGPEPTASSSVTVTGALDADSPPVLTLRGPLQGPLIVNATTGVQLEFDLPLAAVDTLVIDCRAGTVLLNGTADRLYTRTAASAPVEAFTIAPGPNAISLRALSWGAGNTLTLTWRDAAF